MKTTHIVTIEVPVVHLGDAYGAAALVQPYVEQMRVTGVRITKVQSVIDALTEFQHVAHPEDDLPGTYPLPGSLIEFVLHTYPVSLFGSVHAIENSNEVVVQSIDTREFHTCREISKWRKIAAVPQTIAL